MGGRAEKWNRSAEELEGKMSVCGGVNITVHCMKFSKIKITFKKKRRSYINIPLKEKTLRFYF